MRIGIFGGAFDPPHRGHEKAAMALLREAKLDLCYVIPTGIPSHKAVSGVLAEHRLEMTRLAFSSLSDRFRVTDMELCRTGPSYSYLTVRELKRMHPEDSLYLFVGTDQFLAFETWREFRELLRSVTLCVMARYGEGTELLSAKKAELEKEFGAECLLLQEKAYIISSTQVRGELAEKGFSPSLSPAVNEYLLKKDLYGSSVYPERRRLLALLEKELSPSRFSHTLAVEREAVSLCEIFSLPEKEECALAALWHDRTKEWGAEKQIAFLSEAGEALSEEDLKSPAVLHGKTAALLARREGALPLEWVNAIRFHTTGREGMTTAEKVLFFADYIEETRSHSVCKAMRERFYSGLPEEEEHRLPWLDSCILSVMEDTVVHLKKKNFPIHPDTLSGLLDLKRKENI